MPAPMTPTAWRPGVKIALIFGTVLVFWCALASVVWLIFDQPLLHCFDLAFAVLWGLVFLWFLGTWLYGRTVAGRVLLDCGPRSRRWLFLLNAALWLMMGFTGGLAANSVSKAFGIGGPVFGVSFAAYWLILATDRLQVRENGIWQYVSLLRWGKIGSYHWANDSTLVIGQEGFRGLFQGAIPVPPEHKQAVEEFLAKHCSAQLLAEPGAAPDRGGR